MAKKLTKNVSFSGKLITNLPFTSEVGTLGNFFLSAKFLSMPTVFADGDTSSNVSVKPFLEVVDKSTRAFLCNVTDFTRLAVFLIYLLSK